MKCIACGAEIEFSPKDKKLKCSYCGSEFDAKEYREQMTTAKKTDEFASTTGEQIETKAYSCKQCGAKLLTFDDTAITFCSYCGSSNVIEDEMYKGEAPEYVIPFKITKEQCEEIYKKEIKKHIFAPKEMLDDVVIKKFRGIYMPYGVYKATHSGEAINNGEKYSHHSCDYDYYDQYRIVGNVTAEYEGMSYDLSSNFYDKFSQAIAPFNFKEAEKFNINYLSGYYADSRDVKKDIYEADALSSISQDTTQELLKNKEFRKYGCSNPSIRYNIEDKKIAYYPVYFLAVRNKKNDAVNYAVINGQTGKIAVELPIDMKKYLIFTLVLTIPIFLVLFAIFTITPMALLVVTALLALINIFILSFQTNQIKRRESHTDDKGYKEVQANIKSSKNEKIKDENVKVKAKKKLPIGTICVIISFFLPLATIISNPISDIYYYTTGIASLCLLMVSIKEIIMQHNEITSRKLSQIGIRGGDESEN